MILSVAHLHHQSCLFLKNGSVNASLKVLLEPVGRLLLGRLCIEWTVKRRMNSLSFWQITLSQYQKLCPSHENMLGMLENVQEQSVTAIFPSNIFGIVGFGGFCEGLHNSLSIKI